MSIRPRTVILGALGVALVGALAVVALRQDPLAVNLHSLARGPMEVTVSADGQTRIREVYEVAAPLAGTALRSPVRVGDAVVAGKTIVAVVEPVAPSLLDARSRLQAEAALREAEAALHVAESQVRQAQEELSYAQSGYDRVVTLVERGISSVTQLETATQALAIRKAAHDAALSGLEMAKGGVQRSEAALIEPDAAHAEGASDCCIRILAPVDGQVLVVDQVSERPVAAGTRLLSIGQPDALEIVADLLSSDAVRLQPGAMARVDRWGGDKTLSARLRAVDPSARTKISALGIEEQRVEAVFDLLSPPDERPRLGDGFAVSLSIIEWQAEDVLILPLSALFRQGATWMVFTEQDGIAIEKPVRIGRRNAAEAELLEGLVPGDRVILHPTETLRDGMAIVEIAAEG